MTKKILTLLLIFLCLPSAYAAKKSTFSTFYQNPDWGFSLNKPTDWHAWPSNNSKRILYIAQTKRIQPDYTYIEIVKLLDNTPIPKNDTEVASMASQLTAPMLTTPGVTKTIITKTGSLKIKNKKEGFWFETQYTFKEFKDKNASTLKTLNYIVKFKKEVYSFTLNTSEKAFTKNKKVFMDVMNSFKTKYFIKKNK